MRTRDFITGKLQWLPRTFESPFPPETRVEACVRRLRLLSNVVGALPVAFLIFGITNWGEELSEVKAAADRFFFYCLLILVTVSALPKGWARMVANLVGAGVLIFLIARFPTVRILPFDVAVTCFVVRFALQALADFWEIRDFKKRKSMQSALEAEEGA